MRSHYEIVVSDRDEDELMQDGLGEEDSSMSAPQKSSMLKAIHVATVDNFQGEEAEVVIISLVRSNPKRNVGFLKTSNRFNVLLSRAKHGMYIIGNADTARSVPFWARTIDKLETSGCLGDKLELVCPRHQQTPIAVSKPVDFAMFSPAGGCQLRCGQRLDCGHICIGSCHSDLLHRAMECLEPCPKMLACGHSCDKLCHQPCQKSCHVPIEMPSDFQLPCGHHVDTLECRYVQAPSDYRCQVQVHSALYQAAITSCICHATSTLARTTLSATKFAARYCPVVIPVSVLALNVGRRTSQSRTIHV